MLRAIFSSDLTEAETVDLLDRWCSWAQRCRYQPCIKAGRTIRKHREGILAAIRLGLSNARLEGQRVRLIMRRAYGFDSAEAALALVMHSAGPVNPTLPWETAA